MHTNVVPLCAQHVGCIIVTPCTCTAARHACRAVGHACRACHACRAVGDGGLHQMRALR